MGGEAGEAMGTGLVVLAVEQKNSGHLGISVLGFL